MVVADAAAGVEEEEGAVDTATRARTTTVTVEAEEVLEELLEAGVEGLQHEAAPLEGEVRATLRIRLQDVGEEQRRLVELVVEGEEAQPLLEHAETTTTTASCPFFSPLSPLADSL